MHLDQSMVFIKANIYWQKYSKTGVFRIPPPVDVPKCLILLRLGKMTGIFKCIFYKKFGVNSLLKLFEPKLQWVKWDDIFRIKRLPPTTNNRLPAVLHCNNVSSISSLNISWLLLCRHVKGHDTGCVSQLCHYTLLFQSDLQRTWL